MLHRLSTAKPNQKTIEQLCSLHLICLEKAWGEEEMEKLLKREGVFCIMSFTAENIPSGFILFQCVADEGEIVNMGVLPEYRKRGVGKMLLKKAIEHCKGRNASQMWLEVAEDNAAALALYTSLGFAQKGRRKDYYDMPGGRVDALTLSLELPA